MAANERSEVGIDVGLGRTPVRPEPRSDAPFCVLVLGDLGGTAERPPLRERSPIPFDRDDVDAAVARIRPRLSLPAGASTFTLGFASLDDFHPDRLFVDVPIFGSLRELRSRLSNPRTFAAAARELGSATDETSDPGTATETAPRADGSLLDRLIDATEPAAPSHASRPVQRTEASRLQDDLTAFIREVVRPHLVASPDPRQQELVAGVEAALASQMRALLHTPAFQRLESAWRSIDRMARRIETDNLLRLFLIDVADAELDEALDAGAPGGVLEELLERSALELLPGGAPWTVLVVLRSFGASEIDDGRLARLAAIGGALGATVIANADPALAGLASWAELPDPREWKPRESPALAALRASPEAGWLCLAAPRVLLRAPYGDEGEPIDAFDFDEAGDAPAHSAFLWGSAAAAVTVLLAQNFSLRGWSMRPGEVAELDRLPLPLLQRDGEKTPLPCAETLMSERAAERLMGLGITPVATLRDRDAVRVVRFQSFTSPAAALAGRWTTRT